jgi:hypothetical protein
MTDTEKDIENEIKSTEIDESQVADLLSKTLFSDVLRDQKIRYEGNGQDYAYARKLDDQCIGHDADIAINIITTDHPNHSNAATLAAQNTGKTELLAVLPSDLRLIDQARLFLKTEKYVQQNTGGGDETRRVILEQRLKQNGARRNDMLKIASEYLTKVPLYLNGSRLDTVGEGDPRNRFYKACQDLISFAYPSLRMLKGAYDDTTLSKALLEPDDLLTSGTMPPSESEQEVFNYVLRNQNNGERTSVDEIIRVFGRRPYGWYPMAVLTLISRIFRMGKVELRTTELLDARKALELFKNTRQHGSVRVRLQEQFNAIQVNALKKFHHDFFDRANNGADARAAALLTSEALASEARDITVLLDQSTRYTFLEPLRPFADKLAKLAEKDSTYLLNHLGDFEDELLTAKEDLISPIKAFMHGPQRLAYDESTAFLREESANFHELPHADVQPLHDLAASPNPYRGNTVPAAKSAVTKLRGYITDILTAERNQAVSILEDYAHRLQATEDCKALDDDALKQVLEISREALASIQSARFVTGIRDRLHRYTSRDYPAQLDMSSRLAAEARNAIGTSTGKTAAAPVRYTTAASLRPKCPLTFISNEAELEQWLGALRETALQELRAGKRISL